MDNKKEKISNLELLEAMSGINEKYLKEADSLCIKKKNYWHMAVAVAAVIICTIIIPNIKHLCTFIQFTINPHINLITPMRILISVVGFSYSNMSIQYKKSHT